MKRYMRSHILAILVVGFFAGGILLSQALGWWSTETKKVARKITTGELAGKADPADIRGSYTFADIEKNFGVPVKVLAQAFGFDKERDPAGIRAKDIEERYGEIEGKDLGTDAVRLFVSLYTGIPLTSSEENTGILEPAFRILKGLGKITPDKEKELLPIVVRVPSGSVPEAKGTEPATATGGAATTSKEPVPESPGVSSPQASTSTSVTTQSKEGSSVSSTEVLIKGKTTFKEILAWGVTKAQIEKVLGRPMPLEGTVIKDWCTKEGLEFGTIRDALQKLKP